MTTMQIRSTTGGIPAKGIVGTVCDTTVWHAFGVCGLFAAATLNLISLNADKSTVELDAQVIVKLLAVAAAGLYGMLGFLTDHRVREIAFSFPVNCFMAIIGLYFLVSPFGLSPGTSLVSSISILAVFLMTLTALVNLGQDKTIRIIFLSTSTFILGSWVAYVLFPEIGVFAEPVGDGEIKMRMGGLAHPNTLGQCAAFCILTGTYIYYSSKQRSRLILTMILCAVLALLFSLSRSSILATVLALAVGYRTSLFKGRRVVHAAALFVSLAIVAIMAASTQYEFGTLLNEKAQQLSKSGDSEEIFSATGRGEIWAETIRLIKEKPVFGYGPATSKYLLEDYSLYTHNFFLNIGLSCGVGGIILALLMTLARVRKLFLRSNPVADGLVAFILINGIFENVIFGNISGLPTICWVIGLTWFHVAAKQGGDLHA